MWPVSQRFMDTLARDHERRSYVEILQDGVVVATYNPQTTVDPMSGALVQAVGGQVQVDRATVRRSGTIDLLDISQLVTSGSVDELFPPLITEIRPWVGVRYWDASAATGYTGVPVTGTPAPAPDSEYVPLGTLVVSSLADNYPRITVSGFDRMWMVGQFAAQFVVAKNAGIADTMGDVLGAQLPAARIDTSGIIDVEATLPAHVYAEQDDAAQALHDMALAGGQILYVNPMGAFTTRAEATTEDDPVAWYAPGPLGVLMRPTRTRDASNAFNAVVFTSESGTTAPLRGYAQDDDPDSPTYVAAVGVRPYFASSPLLKTQAQADTAAKTRLQNILGFADTQNVPIIPNPAHESGDVVMLTDPQQDIDMPVIIDSFPIGMRASDGQQDLTTRGRVIR